MRTFKTPKEGDRREFSYRRPWMQDPWTFEVTDGHTYVVEPGDRVVVTEVFCKFGWGPVSARPETEEERESRLGPVRWWQWRRRRARRLPKAVARQAIESEVTR